MAAHRRVLDRTASSERPVRSPAKTMCTTCFDETSRFGAIESTMHTGPSTGTSSSIPSSSVELALERVGEALARVDAAARQQPVLLARASRGGRAGSARASRAAPRRGSEARPSGGARSRSRVRRAREEGSSSTTRSSTAATGSDDELRDPHPRLDLEGALAVGVQEDDAQLAAVARVDEAGVFTIVIPCFSARPERGWT